MSHIKVFFIAKIKNFNEDYENYNKNLFESAKKMPGFIDIESQQIDDVEITISMWKSKDDVIKWSKDPEHVEAKRKVYDWYHWVKGIHLECVDDN
jgi:heme-degrading monooxygenase HmoA